MPPRYVCRRWGSLAKGGESGFVMRRHAPLSRLKLVTEVYGCCVCPAGRLVKHRGPVTGEREAQVWGMVWGTQQCQSATQPPSHPDVGHAPSEPSENRLEGSRRSFLERCTAAVATGWIMPALRDTSYPRIDSGFKATDQLQDGSMVP
ncbi:hypothetical protein GY631_4465 [Trichophyton interdigitale]|uniref:Uncharacterized protein n=2 Tax=Trichophyton interdigitale TaxID=101480 RepID=A0A9P4YDZ2_9EURO|nr:hypothetical protein GY631_4465 [Trichophyton interdigitale]KAF3892999.1 hypothetical protein GY632_4428 [Trichophyton interdigitale]